MSRRRKSLKLVLAVLLVGTWYGCTKSGDSGAVGPAEEHLDASRAVVWSCDGVQGERTDGSDKLVIYEARFRVLGEEVLCTYEELLQREGEGSITGDTRIDMLLFPLEEGVLEDGGDEGLPPTPLKNLDEPPVIETCWTCIKLCRADPDCVRECTKERCG